MRLLMVGLNHRTAPIELRERVALSGDRLDAALGELRRRYAPAEAAIVSTCNRTEVYVARPVHAAPSEAELRGFLAELAGEPAERLAAMTIHREQDDAARHLFRLCCGLDSMVFGEPQILGQVKRAYEAANRQAAVGPVLHRVFQSAVASAKSVRSRSGLDRGRVSVGSVAVDFARQVFEQFTDKTVLSIGAGEMIKVVLQRLSLERPGRTWLVNRTAERGVALARQLGIDPAAGGPRPWDDLDPLLVQADVVITGTGSPEPILTAGRAAELVRRRRGRPLLIIDLAVPRDVEPTVGTLRNVYLYNIDDLQSVLVETDDQRRSDAVACEHEIDDAVAACMTEIRHRDLGQLVKQLQERLMEIGGQEHERTARKLAALSDPSQREALEAALAEHTRRLVHKILHLPLSQLDRRNRDAPLAFYAAALRRLFDLHDPEPGAEPPPTSIGVSEAPGAGDEPGRSDSEGEAPRESGIDPRSNPTTSRGRALR